jgi:hypothetical protein
MSNLRYSQPAPRKASQPFQEGDTKLDFSLVDFWSWSASDLLNNVTRGHLAEFIVARALGVAEGVRIVWAAYDLALPLAGDRELKIEVKSAAFLQGWEQDKLSRIQFDIRKTKALDQHTSRYAGTAQRQADVYVFALLQHQDRPTIEPLDVSQWAFYVLPTATLDREIGEGHSISLKALEKLTGAVSYFKLRATVLHAWAGHPPLP